MSKYYNFFPELEDEVRVISSENGLKKNFVSLTFSDFIEKYKKPVATIVEISKDEEKGKEKAENTKSVSDIDI